jgi:hypothetical protein
MNHLDITCTQATKLLVSIEQMYFFLDRLKIRMEEQNFPHDDAYYLRVVKTWNALDTLKTWTFYMTVEQGVGTQPRPK